MSPSLWIAALHLSPNMVCHLYSCEIWSFVFHFNAFNLQRNERLYRKDIIQLFSRILTSDLSLSGLCYEGIYQKKGDPGRVAHLLQEFTKDARVVKLRAQEQRLEDVTDTLKSFLSHSEDALLAKELYPFWISALGSCCQLLNLFPWMRIHFNSIIIIHINYRSNYCKVQLAAIKGAFTGTLASVKATVLCTI